MKRVSTVILFAVLSLAILLPISFDKSIAFAQDNYTIQSVDHEVEVMYSGHMVLRDRIQISGQLEDDFLIGFPYKYGAYVLRGIAYDENNNVFPLNLGVQLNKPGFYGARISFPKPAPQFFTIVFILSNNLLSQDSTGTFTLDFPVYPSFTKEVAYCSVEIILPATPSGIKVSKDDGEISSTSFSKSNLSSFTYSPASVTFSIPTGTLQILNVEELDRRVTISPAGEPAAYDNYRIRNNSPNSLDSIKIGIPTEASNIIAKDQFGRTLIASNGYGNDNTRFINITLTSPIVSGTSTPLTVEYVLPRISSIDPFTLNFDLFPNFNYYVNRAKVTLIPPEGAKLVAPQLSEIDLSISIIREAFQETLSINKEGVSMIGSTSLSKSIDVMYTYSPLWLSFRPTLWMWGLVVVGLAVMITWKRSKTSAPLRNARLGAAISLSPENIRAFVEAYSEKSRLNSELKIIETRAQKGKIPRRRYKVQKKTIEARLDNASKNIASLKKVFRSAAGNYANLVRQLDVAEAELAEVEIDARSVDVRHRKGALPLDAYKKAKADHQRRKEKAEASINGILLRLREENLQLT